METRVAKLRRRRVRQTIFGPLLVLASLASGTALAQTADNYPNRPIRIVVPAAAGSAQDIIVRLL